MSSRSLAPIALSSLLVLLPSVASADVAPPRAEDMNCRPGTVATTPTIDPGATDPRGRPLQPYPYCAARPACASDDACDEGMVCSPAPVGFCLEETEVAPGQTARVPRLRGCEPDGTCLNIHSTCERVRRCVPVGSAEAASPEPADDAPADEAPVGEVPVEEGPADVQPSDEPAESSGGCSVTAMAPSAGLLGVSLPLAWLVLRRRRRAAHLAAR